ncbi:MAG TPA: WXG100 family type VII secretion target [Acidimicrobiales bacterium]|nr:WXG100 family type VII secretion target [Acidimicrobiales bacterium]
MPSWQPNWTDVRFDHAAARAVVEELRRCARLLDDQTDHRLRLAAEATRAWRGPARDRFDGELARMKAQAADLAAALRSAARAIESAADDARLEQARRDADRRRWTEEHRREEARAEAAGAAPPRPPAGVF